MSYIEEINKKLNPYDDGQLNSTVIDLFAGCGGLSLGFEAQGFRTIGYEMNKDATSTYNRNLMGECHCEMLTTETEFPEANVVIGGPPCQPFSVGGNQKGLKDSRDGFPIFISAVKRVQPEFFMFENVRGMLYRNKWYLEEVLEALEDIGGYTVEPARLLNAKFHGVPQNRERIFVVGYRGDFRFPEKLSETITAGEALGEMAFQEPTGSKYLTPSMDKYIAKYEKASHCVNPRDLHLDRPARTLTCRNLAGSTGDMHRIRLESGKRRRVLAREAARLQSFPDWFEFDGNETSVFNQIGNAVPPMLAYHIAAQVKKNLLDKDAQEVIRKRTKQYDLFKEGAPNVS